MDEERQESLVSLLQYSWKKEIVDEEVKEEDHKKEAMNLVAQLFTKQCSKIMDLVKNVQDQKRQIKCQIKTYSTKIEDDELYDDEIEETDQHRETLQNNYLQIQENAILEMDTLQ